jgi:hypothetical protein
MEEILKKYPEFLTVYAPLKDISGAVFKNITVFQHAIWAGDELGACDLAALTALCKVRTEDLELLIQQLDKPIQSLEEDQGAALRDLLTL